MKHSTLLVSLALGSALAVAGALLAPSFAGEHRADPAAERQWLSIAQIHDKLQAAGYRNVEKIERERGGYEVRATDPKGERIKLYVNPQTGEIMSQRGDGKRLPRRHRWRARLGRLQQRRCRGRPATQAASAASANYCHEDAAGRPVGRGRAAWGLDVSSVVAPAGAHPLWLARQEGLYLSGLLSIAMMSLTMFLATRPAWAEAPLGGMDRVYRTHKWAGILAVSLAASHWLIEMSATS
jgi:hypothetical protein